MLQRDVSELSGNLGQFAALIEHSDLFEFNKTLEETKRQPTVECRCHFNSKHGPILIQLFGRVCQINAKGEPVSIEFMVQDQSELSEQTRQAEISENLTKALLNSSRHGVYLLNDSNQVVTCNSAF